MSLYTRVSSNNSPVNSSSEAIDASSCAEFGNPFNSFSLPDISTEISDSASGASSDESDDAILNETARNTNILSEISSSEEALACSTELFMFVQTRIEELKLDFSHASESAIIQWALSAVDFLDELKMMKQSYSPAEADFVSAVKNAVEELFVQNGISTIDSDVWDSTRQKAVSVVRKKEVQNEIITGKQSTGVMYNGNLIRKQEVYLEISDNTTGD